MYSQSHCWLVVGDAHRKHQSLIDYEKEYTMSEEDAALRKKSETLKEGTLKNGRLAIRGRYAICEISVIRFSKS